MNISLQSKLFEVVGSNHVAYLINEKSDFSVTGYKVMQNHSDAGLLKCAKVNYNGKIKLVYLVGNLKPLSYVASRSGVNELAAVITNLIQRALEINSNGFFLAEDRMHRPFHNKHSQFSYSHISKCLSWLQQGI